jgi:hypothetical protein
MGSIQTSSFWKAVMELGALIVADFFPGIQICVVLVRLRANNSKL